MNKKYLIPVLSVLIISDYVKASMVTPPQALEDTSDRDFKTNEMHLSIVSRGLSKSLLQLQNCCYEDPANLLLSELNLLMLEHIRRFKVFEKEYPYYVTRTLRLQSKEAQFLTESAMSTISRILGEAFKPEIQQIALQAFTYSVPWILTIQSKPTIKHILHRSLDKKIADLKIQKSPLICSDETFYIAEANMEAVIVQQKRAENNILFLGLLKSMKLNSCTDAEDPLEMDEELNKTWSANIYLLEHCKAIDTEIRGKNRLLENQIYKILCLRQILTEIQLHIAGKLPSLFLLQKELNPYIDLEFLKRYTAIKIESEELEKTQKELAIRTEAIHHPKVLEGIEERKEESGSSELAKSSFEEDQGDLNDLLKDMQIANTNLQWLAEKLEKESLILDEKVVQANEEIDILQDLLRQSLGADLIILQKNIVSFDKAFAAKYSLPLHKLISLFSAGQEISATISPSSSTDSPSISSFHLSKELTSKNLLKRILSTIYLVDKYYSDDIDILSVTEILRIQLERDLQTIEDNIRKNPTDVAIMPQMERDIVKQSDTSNSSRISSLQDRIFNGLFKVISEKIDTMKEGKAAKARHKEEASCALAYSLPKVFNFCLDPRNILPLHHQSEELQSLLTSKQPEDEIENLLKRIRGESISLNQFHENIDQIQKDLFITPLKKSTSKKSHALIELEKTWNHKNKLLSRDRYLTTQIAIINSQIEHMKLEISIQRRLFTDSNMPLPILGTILQVVHGKVLNALELIAFNKRRTLDSIAVTKEERIKETEVLKTNLIDIIDKKEKSFEIRERIKQRIIPDNVAYQRVDQTNIIEQIAYNKWAIEVLEKDILILEKQFRELTLIQEKLDREHSFLLQFTGTRISGLITDLFKP